MGSLQRGIGRSLEVHNEHACFLTFHGSMRSFPRHGESLSGPFACMAKT